MAEMMAEIMRAGRRRRRRRIVTAEERQQRTEQRLGVGSSRGRSGRRVQDPIDRSQTGGGRQNVRRRGQRAGKRQLVVAAETSAVVCGRSCKRR